MDKNALLIEQHGYLYIRCMDTKEPLLEKKPANKSYLTPQMTPIHRYNIVIDCYNMPCNIVDSIKLESIPESSIYEFIFRVSTHLRGKIVFILLCFIPFINVFPLVITSIFAYTYWASLKVYARNQALVQDPFKRMTFDPQVCFNMGCDYYFFTIELRQLEGFSLNYQENVSERINLRRERGKTNIMVYNANFWAGYNYFQKWNVYHYSPLVFSLILATISNTICVLLILDST